MTKKTSFTRSQEEKNFIGHIVFPYSVDVKNIFFANPSKKNVYGMYWNGDLIQKGAFNSKVISFLEKVGYKFELIESLEYSNRSKPNVDHVPIFATIEYENNDRSQKPLEIIVSYHAKDIIEVGSRGKYVLNKVLELTGVPGRGDIYGKMERC